MRHALFFGLIIVLNTTPAASQFVGTNLDPFATSYPAPPYLYEGSRMVSVKFSTSAEVVRALVPSPLDPVQSDQITAFVVESHLVDPGVFSYYEAGLAISVTYQGVVGFYYPIMYLDEPLAIFPAREIWGFSKVGADININWSPGGDAVSATVSTLGSSPTDLITINADFPTEASIPSREAVTHFYSLKLFPSVEAGGRPDVCQLTRFQATTTSFDLRSGNGALVLGEVATDPLADIPIYGLLAVNTAYQDSDLPFGQVVYDYIAQTGTCDAGFTQPYIFRDSFESGDTLAWSATVP